MHGANLLSGLKKYDPDANFRCWGGDKMKEAGAEIIKHIKDLAFMGFAEVLLNIRTIASNLKFCKQDILNFSPDVLILIDYPGFNLRIAEFAHKAGIKVFYYISPSVWAWKENRVELIKKYIDRMFVILPFEKAFYAKHNYLVEFEGHPLMDEMEKIKNNLPSQKEFISNNGLSGKPLIACMPGSRKQEVRAMLPAMLKLKSDFPAYEFVIAAAPNLPLEFYSSIADLGETKLIYDQTYALLNSASAGLIKSGTSVLEAALFHLPQVCCYYGNALTIAIAKRLAKVKYISLPNLILDKPVVKELIQQDMSYENMKAELKSLLFDDERKKKILQDYNELDELLNGNGVSDRIAKKIVGYLQ